MVVFRQSCDAFSKHDFLEQIRLQVRREGLKPSEAIRKVVTNEKLRPLIQRAYSRKYPKEARPHGALLTPLQDLRLVQWCIAWGYRGLPRDNCDLRDDVEKSWRIKVSILVVI